MGLLTGLGECPLAFGDNPDRLCAWCGTLLAGRRRRWCSDACGESWSDNHAWTSARLASCRRDGWACVRCGASRLVAALEVNHIVPCLGRHAVNGCHHHLDGLETLCHACHLVVTREQRRGRRADQVALAL